MPLSEAQLSRKLAKLRAGQQWATTLEALGAALSLDVPLSKRDARIVRTFADKFDCDFLHDESGLYDPVFCRRTVATADR